MLVHPFVSLYLMRLFQGRVHEISSWDVVVLHFDNDFVVHCKFGRLLNSGKDGFAYRGSRRLSEANENQIRGTERRINRRILQGNVDR